MNGKALPYDVRRAYIVVLSALFAGCASAPAPEIDEKIAEEKISVSHVLDIKVSPLREAPNQRIYVEFKESPKMTKIFRDVLMSRGFYVVADPKEASQQFYLRGVLIVSRADGQQDTTALARILEGIIENNDEGKSAPQAKSGTLYSGQPEPQIGLGTIVLSGVITGFTSSLSITNYLVGAKELLSAQNNRNVPRNCSNPRCLDYRIEAFVLVEDESGSEQWTIKAHMNSKRVMARPVIQEAMEHILNPIYDLKPGSEQLSDPKIVTPPEGNIP